MNKHEDMKQTILFIQDDFTFETKEVLAIFLEFFNLIEIDSLGPESNVKYDKDADYISIHLVAIDSNRISYFFEFFNGLTEIFIDNSIELLLQFKFKNRNEAFDYIKKCLFSEIHMNYLKDDEDKITKYNCKFLLNNNVVIDIGNNLFMRIFKPNLLHKTYYPWIDIELISKIEKNIS